MINSETKLYNIAKDNFNYELGIIKDGDLIRSVRHIVKCAMNSSPEVFSDIIYENVCSRIIKEFKS